MPLRLLLSPSCQGILDGRDDFQECAFFLVLLTAGFEISMDNLTLPNAAELRGGADGAKEGGERTREIIHSLTSASGEQDENP